jgi:hypothetical protein
MLDPIKQYNFLKIEITIGMIIEWSVGRRNECS